MNIRLKLKREIQLQPDVLEEKIEKYLKKNFYRIVDKGPGFVIFIDDEFSDRKSYRSDYHTRIGKGKFEFHTGDQNTSVTLIYLTPILYPILLMAGFGWLGISVRSFMPIVMSFAILIPFLHRVYYLKEHVFKDVLGS